MSDTTDPPTEAVDVDPTAGSPSTASAAETESEPDAAEAPGGVADSEEISDAAPTISVEDHVADLERVSTERDDYLDALRRLQAEFENYRKAVAKREADARERANDKIVGELLPVIDACDGAVANGATDVEPIRRAIVDNLSRQGLQRLEPAGEAFDPELHEAVMHEDSSEVDVPTVAEVLRVGYGWNGRVLRPAMVKTKG